VHEGNAIASNGMLHSAALAVLGRRTEPS
jgi:hypothetical protein